MALYTKVTNIPWRTPVDVGPIRCEVRTTPEDLLVCVVEQDEEGITVYALDGAAVKPLSDLA